MKPFAALSLAFVLLLLAVGPVSAAPPVIETGHLDIPPVEPYPGLCPGIVVLDHEVLDYRMTTFYNNAGEVRKITVHYTGTNTFYNQAKPEVQLVGHSSASAEFDLETGELINATGLVVNVTIPGEGSALILAGSWSLYPYSHDAGKDSFEDPEDIAQFCAYLTGN